jgi:PKD repeat protein
MIDDIVVSTESSTNSPVANFSGNPTNICDGNSVNFTDASSNNPTSWSWAFPGGTPSSSSSQNPTVTYNTPGTYNVSLTASNSTGNNSYTRSSYITVDDCNAIEDDFASKINIYPNPTDGILNIELPEANATLKISNILGKEVISMQLSSDHTVIDLNSLSAGMYFVEIQLSEAKIVSKINVR